MLVAVVRDNQDPRQAEEFLDELEFLAETADIRAELEREVCAPFAADYRAGRTPLPCARCNPAVKFPALFALSLIHISEPTRP